jgi:hypothetical protein
MLSSKKPNIWVELDKGVVRWFYRIRAQNGNIITTSQKYFNKTNARRAAKATALRLGARYKEVV